MIETGLCLVVVLWLAVSVGRFLRQSDEKRAPESKALVPYGKYDLKNGADNG